jgi:hypothetical protein
MIRHSNRKRGTVGRPSIRIQIQKQGVVRHDSVAETRPETIGTASRFRTCTLGSRIEKGQPDA